MGAETECFLIVERDADLREIYRRKLRQFFPKATVIDVDSCAEALTRLAETRVDAAVVNQVAADMRGPALLRTLHQAWPSLPLVSIGETALESESLRAGAAVFIDASKAHELGPVVRHALGAAKKG